jgi:hypothetical protein
MHGASDEGATQENCRLEGRKILFVEIAFEIEEYSTDKGGNPHIIARASKPKDSVGYAGKKQNSEGATGNDISICDFPE